MTTPGVPMLFAGDELGLEGAWGEDARRTMPWADRGTWDTSVPRRGARARRAAAHAAALARGGIRYVHVSADAIVYLRETRDGAAALPRGTRAARTRSRHPFTALETLYGEDAANGVLPADGPAFHLWRIQHG